MTPTGGGITSDGTTGASTTPGDTSHTDRTGDTSHTDRTGDTTEGSITGGDTTGGVGRTQAERRAAGIDVMTTLMATDAEGAERMAGAMERRHGHLGSFANDHVLGYLWSRPQLSRRDRSLIVVTFLATIGARAELATHTEGALNHGLTRDEIREVVNQVAGYAGFPMAMQATRIVDETFARLDGVDRLPAKEPAPPVDDEHRRAMAADVLATLTEGRAASDPAEARAGIVDALGGVGEMAFDWGFGELWARDELSRRDRSMVTVAILAILRCSEELAFHVPAALHHGVTRPELEEIMVQLTVYGGFPRAVEGMRAARAAITKLDRLADETGETAGTGETSGAAETSVTGNISDTGDTSHTDRTGETTVTGDTSGAGDNGASG